MVDYKEKAKEIRRDIVTMIHEAKSGHPGGSLSIVELLVHIYYKEFQEYSDGSRDKFILSKGHAAPALYAVLADKGFIEKDELKNFRKLESILQGHPDYKKCNGVDVSTGSLGQGVSNAVGMALGFKLQKKENRVFTILGDGELQEGLVWEALMSAAHYKLDNLVIVIDNNGLQIDGKNDEVMSLGDLKGKINGFGLNCIEVDGHDLSEIEKAFGSIVKGNANVIIANTIKGKGVDFMENNVNWHGAAPSTEDLKNALEQLA